MRKVFVVSPEILALPVTDIMHVKKVIDNARLLQEFMDNKRLAKYERYRSRQKAKKTKLKNG
jgi:hypothetical protein